VDGDEVALRFRLLGPLAIEDWPLPLPGGQRRRILSLLVARPNESLTADWLVDDLWGEQPPATARTALHVHISHLRKALHQGRPGRVVTEGAAYRLEVPTTAVDWLRFEDLLERAERTSGAKEREACLAEALALWRGPAFDGQADPGDVLGRLATRLGEGRRSALIGWSDLVLHRQGDPSRALAAAIAGYPYDEDLSARLATALATTGRPSDALAEVRRCVAALHDDLGLSPQAGLVELELAILDNEHDLVERFCPMGGDRDEPTTVARPRPDLDRPRASIATPFVGRSGLVAGLLEGARQPTWIVGPAGRGKTRLLAELADLVPEEDIVRFAAAERHAPVAASVLRRLFPELGVDRLVAQLTDVSPTPSELGLAVADEVREHPRAGHEWWLVDDAHWLSGDDWTALRRLARDIDAGGLPVALIVAGRQAPPAAGPAARVWDVLELPPLSDAAVATILGAEARSTTPELLAAVRGEPLLAAQLGAAASAAGGLAQVPDTADVLRLAVESIQRSLEADARHLVDVLSVAAAPMAREQLQQTLQWPPTRLDTAIESAAQSGLVTPAAATVDIAHDSLREPLLRSVEPTIRDRWALALRRSNLASSARPVGPAPARDTASAVSALLHAGREALRSLAFAEASRIGALGVELARPGSPEAAEARLIQARGISDELGEERFELLDDAWTRAVVLDDHRLMVEIAVELAGPWAPGNRVDHRAIERLRQVARAVTDPGLRSQVQGRIVSFSLGQTPDAEELAAESWRNALEVGDTDGLCAAAHARCYASLGRAPAKERRDLARECLDMAERAGLYERAAGLANHLFVAAAALDDPVDTDRAVASYRRAADATARPTHRWRVAYLDATRAMAEGDLPRAADLSHEAARLGAHLELEDAWANHLVQQFCITLLEEDLDALRPLAPRDDGRPLAVASRLAAAAARGRSAEVEVERARCVEHLAGSSRDYLWPGAAFLMQWSADLLGDADLADRVHDAVRPLLGERAVLGMGMGVLGPF
jgi:DNA-binding SARP family transcriptional activator